MATATKSTLNAKLPSVDKIAFCTAAGKNMCEKLYTGENGKFSMKVGFRQKSKAYPFQIQYRVRSRYTQANAKKKGANWTAWTVWKNAIAMTGIAVDATETAKPVNRWMKANKGVNKNSTYATFYNFSGYQIPAGYDARQFQFRIRTFNKAQAKHGNWATQVLSVYKRAAIVDEQGITAPDGGFRVKFNYIWDRSISMQVSSVKDSEGRQLLRKSFTTKLEAVKLTSSTIPPSRSGYSGGQVTVPLSMLKRKIEDGEHLTCTINAVTGDGASTKLVFSEIVDLTASIPLTMNTSWEENRGILTVTVVNANAMNIEALGMSCSYSYNGKAYSVPAIAKSVNLTGTSTFYFYPPIGLPLALIAKAEDQYNRKGSVSVTNYTVTAKGYRLNKVNDRSICGVGWGQPNFTLTSTPQFETALPFGRNKNVIFYGNGDTTTIVFTAKIVDKAGLYASTYARKSGWDKVRGNQGVYYFRSNKGDMFKVGITNFTLMKSEKDVYDIVVEMVEVV